MGSILVGAMMIKALLDDPGFDMGFVVFVGVNMLISLIVGVGILSRRRWGLALFKGYLYLLMLGVPIGTYIAQKTFLYIRENHVERLYR